MPPQKKRYSCIGCGHVTVVDADAPAPTKCIHCGDDESNGEEVFAEV